MSNFWIIVSIGLLSPTIVVPLLLFRGMKPIEAFTKCSISVMGWSAFFLIRRIVNPLMERIGLSMLIGKLADDPYFYGSLFILIGWIPFVAIILFIASENKN